MAPLTVSTPVKQSAIDAAPVLVSSPPAAHGVDVLFIATVNLLKLFADSLVRSRVFLTPLPVPPLNVTPVAVPGWKVVSTAVAPSTVVTFAKQSVITVAPVLVTSPGHAEDVISTVNVLKSLADSLARSKVLLDPLWPTKVTSVAEPGWKSVGSGVEPVTSTVGYPEVPPMAYDAPSHTGVDTPPDTRSNE
ncbi:MAG: hypothetical protein ACRDY1_04685 [Acidimicrobiales bacterium]